MDILKFQFVNADVAKVAVDKLKVDNCKCAQLGSAVVVLANMQNRNDLVNVLVAGEGYTDTVTDFDKNALLGAL